MRNILLQIHQKELVKFHWVTYELRNVTGEDGQLFNQSGGHGPCSRPATPSREKLQCNFSFVLTLNCGALLKEENEHSLKSFLYYI